MSLKVLEVLDELETPRRRVELLNYLYYSNYSIDNVASFKDNEYVCSADKLYQ